MKSIITLLFCTLHLVSNGQNLLFKSGFEDTVKLSNPIGFNGEWYRYFSGADLSTGYVWPTDLPTQDTMDAFWTFKVPDTTALTNYADVQIDSTVSHSGSKSLYMQVSDYDNTNFGNSMAGWVRCEYRLNLDSTMTQGYISYWMKVQPNFYNIMQYGSGRWRIIMEWFESASGFPDYRWGISPRTGQWANDSTSAYWKIYMDSTDLSQNFVGDTGTTAQGLVPVDEWFKMEVYWHQADDSSGVVRMALNGTEIINLYGPNMMDSFIRNWQIFKLYVDPASMDDGLVYQWIDDVEIWDTIPGQFNSVKEHRGMSPFMLRTYPNPATSQLTIEWSNPAPGEPVQVLLFNSLGQLTYEHTVTSTNTWSINTGQLASGMYLLEIRNQNSGKLDAHKVIVRH